MIEIFFIGTGASVPTKERGLPCIVLRRKGELLMFDCGEGSQRSFLLHGFGVNRPMKIFITHMHGDHVLGVLGLIQSMGLLGRKRPLEIYGPRGLEELIETVERIVPFHHEYEVRIHEVKEGVVCETDEYVVRAILADHVIPNYAYVFEEKPRPGRFHPERALALGVPQGPLWSRLQKGEPVVVKGRVIRPEEVLGPPRKGLKIVYSGDTRPCRALVEASMNADVLIHDSTLLDNLREKALEDGHSTARLAAEVAKKARVRLLVLFHISARYAGMEHLLVNEARQVMENVIVPIDGQKLELKYES